METEQLILIFLSLIIAHNIVLYECIEKLQKPWEQKDTLEHTHQHLRNEEIT